MLTLYEPWFSTAVRSSEPARAKAPFSVKPLFPIPRLVALEVAVEPAYGVLVVHLVHGRVDHGRQVLVDLDAHAHGSAAEGAPVSELGDAVGVVAVADGGLDAGPEVCQYVNINMSSYRVSQVKCPGRLPL